MKFRKANGIDASAVGIAYFASCLRELLFEYTPASYKPTVMTPPSLTTEALDVIRKVGASSMDLARIQPILDELRSAIAGDSVAKQLLSFPIEYYTFFSKEIKLQDLSVRLGILQNHLRRSHYLPALQNELMQLCSSDHEKEEIRKVARSWVSVLKSVGYSPRFLSDMMDEQFYGNGSEPVYRESRDLQRFFSIFSCVNIKAKVYFVVNNMICGLEPVSKRFEFTLPDSMDSVHNELKTALVKITTGEVVVSIDNIEAKDIYSLRLIAEKRLEHLSDLFALFHHKRKITWRDVAFVRMGTDELRPIQRRVPAVKRSRDNVPRKAAEKLTSNVSSLTFSDANSVGRFVSVVRLHGAAQETVSAEAQVVNLWTAMEVLVPRESGSKLRGVLKLIVPFLVYGYFDRLVYALAGDLYRWNRSEISKILRIPSLSGWMQHQKLAVVLLGGEYDSSRNRLYELASGYPLLLNRCFNIADLILNTEHLERRIVAHMRTVMWQVERIYRARNSVVHDGSAPRYIDVLAENAHEYLDIVIERFLVLCAQLRCVANFDEAITFQAKQCQMWLERLKKHEALDVNNVRALCGMDTRI